jgi:hypothetical protein
MLIHINWSGKSLHLTIQRHQMNAITFIILKLVLSSQEKVHVSFCPYLGKLQKQTKTGGGASFFEQVVQSSDIIDTYRQQPFSNNG